jgi:hypothetical protein
VKASRRFARSARTPRPHCWATVEERRFEFDAASNAHIHTGIQPRGSPCPAQAAAILRIKSSCSTLLSAPIVNASSTPSESAYLMPSS